MLRLGVTTDTSALFSERLPWRQRTMAIERAFPRGQDLLVAVVDGATPEEADGDRRGAGRFARDRSDPFPIGLAPRRLALSRTQRPAVPRQGRADQAARRHGRRAALPRPARRRPQPARADVSAWADRAGRGRGPGRSRRLCASAGRVPRRAVAGGVRAAGAALLGAPAGRVGGRPRRQIPLRAGPARARLRRARARRGRLGRAARRRSEARPMSARPARARPPDRPGRARRRGVRHASPTARSRAC